MSNNLETVPKNNLDYSGMYLCFECNGYGFPSAYTLITSDDRLGMCTVCANRLRFDGKHDVNTETMEITRKTKRGGIMESYTVSDERVLFSKPSSRPGITSVAVTLSKEVVLKCAEEIKRGKNIFSSNEICKRVIEAENELKSQGEKEDWYRRACKTGICPKCGNKVESYIPQSPYATYTQQYKCTVCPFDIIKVKK